MGDCFYYCYVLLMSDCLPSFLPHISTTQCFYAYCTLLIFSLSVFLSLFWHSCFSFSVLVSDFCSIRTPYSNSPYIFTIPLILLPPLLPCPFLSSPNHQTKPNLSDIMHNIFLFSLPHPHPQPYLPPSLTPNL